MSVAFTKEESAETASETQLPDRPISPHPNLVTEAGLKALELQSSEALKAYEEAHKIEDVNERRRQSATPLRDARYFAARVRTVANRESCWRRCWCARARTQDRRNCVSRGTARAWLG